MSDDLGHRESVQGKSSFSQGNASYQRYQFAVNQIPSYSAVAYCHAAALRLKLPSCESFNEQNEYLAFIIPQKPREQKFLPVPTAPVPCKPYCNEKSSADETHYVPRHSRCRWNTEYRSTIDDCAKKRMSIQPKRSRSPAHVRKRYPPNVTLQPPLPAYSRSNTGYFVETGYLPTQRSTQTANLYYNDKLKKCEQKRIYKKEVEVDASVSQKIPFPKSIAYKSGCVEQKLTPELNVDSCKRPMKKCFPTENSSANEGMFQKSCRRPMPRCQFQSC